MLEIIAALIGTIPAIVWGFYIFRPYVYPKYINIGLALSIANMVILGYTILSIVTVFAWFLLLNYSISLEKENETNE